MSRKKRRAARPWWGRRRVVRRAALAGSLVAAVALVVWIFTSFGGSGEGNITSQDLAKPAPSFTLPTVAGDEVSLTDHLGQHVVLLFFNEGMGCAPCFDQIVDLEEIWDGFEELDVRLVSIMVDPLDMLAAEARRLGITTIVAADEDRSVSNTYDAMEASMHPGIKPGHTFVLIDKGGQMIWRWDWPGHGAPMYVEVDQIYAEVSRALDGPSTG